MQEVCADGAKKQEPRELSKDSDATFIKKGNSCNLRYKVYLAKDKEGYDEKVVVRPANESEQINFRKNRRP